MSWSRGSWGVAAAALIAASVAGCGTPGAGTGEQEGGSSGASVTGAWCGMQVATAADCLGDQVVYLELQQAGSVVTGRSCEQYNTGCYDLQAGALAGAQLTYFYTFDVDRVDATLTVDDVSSTLTGEYDSTKCTCQIPELLHRIP
jgi:hypothetical protein